MESLATGQVFLSTLSLRRATSTGDYLTANETISIHALLAESDIREPAQKKRIESFLSTLSLRRATCRNLRTGRVVKFLSTLSLRRATPSLYQLYDTYAISIHALLAESDDLLDDNSTMVISFLSTLSLRRATLKNNIFVHHNLFLSTLSLRRATR